MTSPRDTALDLISFIDASPSPYHAAAEALRRLTAAGFTEVAQAQPWPSGPGRYVVTDGGSLFAWVVPEGAAADSPIPAARRAYRQPDAAGQAAPGYRPGRPPAARRRDLRRPAAQLLAGPRPGAGRAG